MKQHIKRGTIRCVLFASEIRQAIPKHFLIILFLWISTQTYDKIIQTISHVYSKCYFHNLGALKFGENINNWEYGQIAPQKEHKDKATNPSLLHLPDLKTKWDSMLKRCSLIKSEIKRQQFKKTVLNSTGPPSPLFEHLLASGTCNRRGQSEVRLVTGQCGEMKKETGLTHRKRDPSCCLILPCYVILRIVHLL